MDVSCGRDAGCRLCVCVQGLLARVALRLVISAQEDGVSLSSVEAAAAQFNPSRGVSHDD